MMKEGKFIILFALIFLWFSSLAQVDIKVGITDDTINVGQNLKLSVEIKVEDAVQIESLKINVFDSLGLSSYLFPDDTLLQEEEIDAVDFEISDYGKWPESGTNLISPIGGNNFGADQNGVISNNLQLKIWDTGHFLVMVDEIIFKREDRTLNSFYPEVQQSGLFYVNGPDELKEEETEMMPIKDIIREGWHWLDFKWFYLAVALAALLVFLITRPFRFKRNKNKPPKDKIVIRPAHEIALEKLERLKSAGIWKKGEIKTFQSTLSFIVREYLENRFTIRALESTTVEIMDDLSHVDLPDADVQRLSDLLQIADLVKFAKAKPHDSIHEQFLDYAYTFVKNTKLESLLTER